MCEKCTCWPAGLGRIRWKLHSRKACRPTRLGSPCESPNCTFGLLRQQTEIPVDHVRDDLHRVGVGRLVPADGHAAADPVPDRVDKAGVQVGDPDTAPDPVVLPGGEHRDYGSERTTPAGLQFRRPPPPRSRTLLPIRVLCTTMPRASVEMMLPPTVLLLVSVGPLRVRIVEAGGRLRIAPEDQHAALVHEYVTRDINVRVTAPERDDQRGMARDDDVARTLRPDRAGRGTSPVQSRSNSWPISSPGCLGVPWQTCVRQVGAATAVVAGPRASMLTSVPAAAMATDTPL